jgi:arsenate reductase
MAEAILRDLAGDRFEAISAGYEPAAEICPDAIEAMREIGIDLSGQRPKKTDELLGQPLAYVITLCDRQKERSCPIFPGAASRLIWPLPDPLQSESLEERKTSIRIVRDEIRRCVLEFVSEHA